MPIRKLIPKVEMIASYSLHEMQRDINSFLDNHSDIAIVDFYYSTSQHPEESVLYSVLIYYKI